MRPQLALLLVAAFGCRRSPDEQVLRGLPNLPGGNPVVPAEAMYPWPSDFYLQPDPDTATGRRLVLPAEALPEGVFPEDFAAHDGFTRAPAVLTWFPEGVDPASLPSVEGSIEADSSVRLVALPDLEPVPLLAELDLRAASPDDQALILRPMRALEPATTHVAIVTSRLRGGQGQAITPSDAFRALRDSIPTDLEAVEVQRESYEAVNQAIDDLGLDPEEVVLAWPFTTRSREQVVGPVLSMHDQVMAAPLDPWVPISDVQDGSSRLIEGEIQVLDFLGTTGRITLDDDGVPIASGTRPVRFLLNIPDSVNGPRPVVVFGHGFFSAQEEITWGSLADALHQWGFNAIATDFIGFNEDDAVPTFTAVGAGIGALAMVAEQQLQSHAHFTALARLVKEQLAADLSIDRGAGAFAPLDPASVPYMGISNGGSQGSVIVAASPMLDRGALVVPGGGWSHMMQRAVQWGMLGGILEERYTRSRELQVVLALTQQLLDPVDALNYADHLAAEPFPGRSPKQVTLHMAVGDAQVANLVTGWVARTAGIPMITPSTHDFELLDRIEAVPPSGWSGNAALFVYDEGYPPLPEGNLSPPEDNDAHDTIRDLDSYKAQVGQFLETGLIAQVCDGACDPE